MEDILNIVIAYANGKRLVNIMVFDVNKIWTARDVFQAMVCI